MFDPHQILLPHRAAIRDRERERLDRAVDRPPDIDDAIAALEQGVGFVGTVQTHPIGGRGGRLVDVHAGHGRARGGRVRAPDGVVEEDDALGAGHVVEQQLRHFRVVDRFDVGVRGEFFFFRGDMREGGEGVFGKAEAGFVPAHVGDGDGDAFGAEVEGGGAGWGGADPVVGFGAVGGWGVEVEGGGYGTAVDLVGGGGGRGGEGEGVDGEVVGDLGSYFGGSGGC